MKISHHGRVQIGGRTEISATVSYRRLDGHLSLSKVGYGRTLADAVRDADEQLRPGKWRRLAVSTTGTIHDDVKNVGRRRTRRRGAATFEAKVVSVPAPREVRW